jgi:hypothetical protein
MITFKTKAEIRAFQKKHGLHVDGIAGEQTKRVLAVVNRPISQSARKEPDKSAMKVAVEIEGSKGSIAALEKQMGPVKSKAIKDAVYVFPMTTARKITKQFMHCSATPEGRKTTMLDIRAWHRQRGWPMEGYHGGIPFDGIIERGRPIGMTGSHAAKGGNNLNSVGWVYYGGVSSDMKHPKDTRTPEQKLCAAYLIVRTKAVFGITGRALGHNEVDSGKACPSFAMATDFLGKI